MDRQTDKHKDRELNLHDVIYGCPKYLHYMITTEILFVHTQQNRGFVSVLILTSVNIMLKIQMQLKQLTCPLLNSSPITAPICKYTSYTTKLNCIIITTMSHVCFSVFSHFV